MERCWTFNVALDMSNHLSTGYLDMRVRAYLDGNIQNFHVVSLPIRGVHTGAAMFNAFQKFFDVLCPAWKEKVLSCASDGEAKMTGRTLTRTNGLFKFLLPTKVSNEPGEILVELFIQERCIELMHYNIKLMCTTPNAYETWQNYLLHPSYKATNSTSHFCFSIACI